MAVPGDYNPNIPQPTDQLSVSQGDLLDNFGAIYELIDINHVNFDAGADAGKHKFVQFPTQAADPGTTATELAIYAKNSYGNPAVPALYVQKSGSPAVANGGFTEAIGVAGAASNGWTRTASGLLLKWGFDQAAGAIGSYVISYPVAGTIPVFSAVYTIQLSSVVSLLNPTALASLISGTVTTTQFQVYKATAAVTQFYWLAIGV